MAGKRIVKFPKKEGSIPYTEIQEAVRRVKEKFIKIGRIGAMEVRIHIEVQKVDNGFILYKDIHGIRMQDKPGEETREVYVMFPQVRARIIELLKKIAGKLEEGISEKIPGKD